MATQNLEKEKIAILGFGVEGQSIAKWLSNNNLHYSILDQNPLTPDSTETEDLIQRADNVYSGENYLQNLNQFTYIFRSPGVVRFSKELIEFETNHTITSATQWFFEHCPCPIIGITGTKGKGTTSTLIYELLQAEVNKTTLNTSSLLKKESRIFLTGNIGKNSPLDFLNDLKLSDIVVYELSSFQLEDLNLSPHIAVVLMVTSEHLDHHSSTLSYHDAKSNIAQHQTKSDFVIYNQDFEGSKYIALKSQGTQIPFSRHPQVNSLAYQQNGEVVIKLNQQEFKIDASQKKLIGDHNYENIIAASVAALICGVETDTVERVIKTFTGLKHRLSKVAEISGISFIDDSISTTPESSIAAIQSFQQPLIVILGGSSKHSDFSTLAQTIKQSSHIKAVLLVGSTAQEIANNLKQALVTIPMYFPKSGMGSIFEQLKTLTAPGDAVLLSPACASFDEYKNYQDRGDQFTNLALSFKHEK